MPERGQSWCHFLPVPVEARSAWMLVNVGSSHHLRILYQEVYAWDAENTGTLHLHQNSVINGGDSRQLSTTIANYSLGQM